MERKKNYYRTITRRLLLVIFFLSVAPIICFGILANNSIKETSVVKLRELAISTAENRGEVISMFLREKVGLLKMIVSLYPEAYLREQKNLEQLFLAISQSGDIVDLQIIDSIGVQHSYVGPYLAHVEGKRYDSAQWFKETLIRGVHVSDVFTGYRNVPHFVIAVTNPVKRYVLRATINSSFFNSLLYSAQLGPNGDAYIVNRQGEFQTPSLQQEQGISAEAKRLISFENKSHDCVTDRDILATSWLANEQWVLIVKANIRDSFDHFYTLRHRLIMLVGVISLVAITGAAFASHTISRNLEKADKEHAVLSLQFAQVEKMATIGRLAAGVAHEINNPLQLITSQAGWIGELLADEDRKQLKNYDEYCDAVLKIKYHVERAGTITHRLLGFSRKIGEQKESVDINELLQEAISFVEKEAEYSDIRIKKKLTSGLPLTMTDGPQLQQVLLNLINNAIDAIEKNGLIEVETCLDPGGHIAITIADSGPGIDPENIKQIFDPFFTTKALGKGTGLGLYICYDIMKKLGGTIAADNGKTGGAIFTVTLPVQKTAA